MITERLYYNGDIVRKNNNTIRTVTMILLWIWANGKRKNQYVHNETIIYFF